MLVRAVEEDQAAGRAVSLMVGVGGGGLARLVIIYGMVIKSFQTFSSNLYLK